MTTESAKAATRKYKAAHIKRVVVEMQRAEWEKLKAHAENAGEPIATYIKKAINGRMKETEGGAKNV